MLQILFQEDLNSTDGFDWQKFLNDRMHGHPALVKFGMQLLSGVRGNLAGIDAVLQRVSTNWRVGRMPPVDRNILRLATFELKFSGTPPRVVIDEAINLAKRFGGKNSPQFVNGLLDRILKENAPENPVALAPSPAGPAPS